MSERLPNLVSLDKPRLKPTEQILRSYHDNQKRLLLELAKEDQDRFTRNNIRAYRHIIHWLEETYEL